MTTRETRACRLPVLLLTALFLIAAPLGTSPSAASCAGPTVELSPHDVERGGIISVSGMGWGDNCYDAGPPPAGEGDLGKPITDISVVIRQGTKEWLVAKGSADDEYRFSVEVTVPADLAPGEAELTVRYDLDNVSNSVAYNPDPVLRISDTEVVGAQTAPVTFGPEETTHAAQVTEASDPRDGSVPRAAIGAIGAVALLGIAWLFIWRRRNARPQG